MATNLVKNGTLALYTIWYSKWIAISQFLYQNIKQNEFLYIVYNFGNISSSNPRDCEGNSCTLLDERAKIGISDQISQ